MLRAADGRESLMSHAYVSNLMHCTFSTKGRYPFIESELELRLWPYLGGIARQNRMKALAIGGTVDHLHALLSLPGRMSFAKAVQLIKGGTSKWVHDTFPRLQRFAWQEGYGAFSVSASQVPKTIAYIENQKEHHQKKTFREELLELVQRHGIEYDPRYIL
ncbi:MAG: REP-associated tyrosine transposase [Acidobacteriota bacterium]|nr:REP-associated tyrosine transposase [Acidobacteriota bacterium]